jgi:hypothetical protein
VKLPEHGGVITFTHGGKTTLLSINENFLNYENK